MTPDEREEYLMERVERLWRDWSNEYCTCNCHVDKWWSEWRIYNDHVLRAAAEWGVDQYTFGDGDKLKVTFSDECLDVLGRSKFANYHRIRYIGSR